jgi:hypothetical protein
MKTRKITFRHKVLMQRDFNDIFTLMSHCLPEDTVKYGTETVSDCIVYNISVRNKLTTAEWYRIYRLYLHYYYTVVSSNTTLRRTQPT